MRPSRHDVRAWTERVHALYDREARRYDRALDVELDAVFVTHLARTQQTAAPTAKARNHVPTILPADDAEAESWNFRYVERLVKFLLWQRGGFRVFLGGDLDLGARIASLYSPEGARSFDHSFMGEKAYRRPFEMVSMTFEELPSSNEAAVELGADGIEHRWMAVAEDHRSPGLHVVEIAVAIDVLQPGALGARKEHRGTAYRAKGAHR